MRTFAEKQKLSLRAKSSNPTRTNRTFSAQSPEVSSILHLRRSAGNQTVQRNEGETADPAPKIVYLCSKDLDTSPMGKHAFFRIGSPAKGSTTISLQPIDSSLGVDCWQGIPGRNYSSDLNADADCQATSISESCLEREFRGYPIGHYCTWGPNSNTFVGVVARNCGMKDPDPTGWTPGIDDSAPPRGTYAPDKWTTLAGCETKKCIIGPDDQDSQLQQV